MLFRPPVWEPACTTRNPAAHGAAVGHALCRRCNILMPWTCCAPASPREDERAAQSNGNTVTNWCPYEPPENNGAKHGILPHLAAHQPPRAHENALHAIRSLHACLSACCVHPRHSVRATCPETPEHGMTAHLLTPQQPPDCFIRSCELSILRGLHDWLCDSASTADLGAPQQHAAQSLTTDAAACRALRTHLQNHRHEVPQAAHTLFQTGNPLRTDAAACRPCAPAGMFSSIRLHRPRSVSRPNERHAGSST